MGGRSEKKSLNAELNRRNGGTEDSHEVITRHLRLFFFATFWPSSVPPFLLFNQVIGHFLTVGKFSSPTKVNRNRFSAIPEIWGDHLQRKPSPMVVIARSLVVACANSRLASLKRARNKFRPSLPSTISAVESASLTIADG